MANTTEPNTTPSNNGSESRELPKNQQFKELNVTAGIFGCLSTLLTACLQAASQEWPNLGYFISVAPTISAVITYFIIKYLRMKNYTEARLSVLSDIEEKYNRICKKIDVEIKEQERKKSREKDPSLQEMYKKRIEQLLDEKAKTSSEEREKLKSAEILPADTNYVKEIDSTWLKNNPPQVSPEI